MKNVLNNLMLISSKTDLEITENDIKILDKKINRSRLINFKKFGKKIKMVECELKNEKGTFIVYYFEAVYECLKHIKTIKYIQKFNTICIQVDKLDKLLELASKTKTKLGFSLDISKDYFEII